MTKQKWSNLPKAKITRLKEKKIAHYKQIQPRRTHTLQQHKKGTTTAEKRKTTREKPLKRKAENISIMDSSDSDSDSDSESDTDIDTDSSLVSEDNDESSKKNKDTRENTKEKTKQKTTEGGRQKKKNDFMKRWSEGKKGENSKEDAAKTTNTVPLKTLRGADSVDKVSTLSCGTRHSMETETMKLLKTCKDTIEVQVRAYVKKKWYDTIIKHWLEKIGLVSDGVIVESSGNYGTFDVLQYVPTSDIQLTQPYYDIILPFDDITAVDTLNTDSMEILAKEYREYGNAANEEFYYFVTRILSAINPGKTNFRLRKTKDLISTIFTVTDEAFALMIIDNDGSANGWDKEGRKVFAKLCKKIQTLRENPETGINLEKMMLQRFYSESNPTSTVSNNGGTVASSLAEEESEDENYIDPAWRQLLDKMEEEEEESSVLTSSSSSSGSESDIKDDDDTVDTKKKYKYKMVVYADSQVPKLAKGDGAKFEDWYRQFEAYADKHKYGKLLTTTAHKDLPPAGLLTPHEELSKAQKKALKRHNAALHDFYKAFSDNPTGLAVMEKSKLDRDGTPETNAKLWKQWPRGRVHRVVDELMREYRKAESTQDREQLNQDLRNRKLAPGAPPLELITSIYALQRQSQYKSVSPALDELCVAFKAALPPYLLMQITSTMDDLMAAGTSEIELWERLNVKATNLYKAARSVQARGGKAKEMSLFGSEITDVGSTDKRDKWSKNAACYWCREKGHKAYQCEKCKAGEPKVNKKANNNNNNNDNNNGNNSTGNSNSCKGGTPPKCSRCGGRHKAVHCWEDEKNASKRPAGWTSKFKDVQGATIDYNFCLLALQTSTSLQLLHAQKRVTSGEVQPDGFDLLYDDHVFVFDTGATSHSSNSMRCATNWWSS
eukprot:jgi/Psemu1/52583/gm1.52583_g